jgi:hypothetical protein
MQNRSWAVLQKIRTIQPQAALYIHNRVQTRLGEKLMSRTLLLIIVIILLLAVLPTWPYSSGWGYYPSGGLGLILIILLILLVVNRSRV